MIIWIQHSGRRTCIELFNTDLGAPNNLCPKAAHGPVAETDRPQEFRLIQDMLCTHLHKAGSQRSLGGQGCPGE